MSLGDRFDAVMQQAKRGEAHAIATLYEDVTPSLLRFLGAREPQEAEDLCSETWLHLARLIPGFEGKEREWFGLVFLVARRNLNDHWKRRKRRRTDPVDTAVLAAVQDATDVEARGLDVISSQQAIELVTAALTRDQADVILLRVVAGLGVNEVAEALRKRPSAVRVIQHRALRRLAERIGPSSGFAGQARPAAAFTAGAAADAMPLPTMVETPEGC